MLERQRLGGVAAIIEAATFVFGFIMFGTVLADYTTGDLTAGESVEFVANNEFALYIWNLVILIIFGIALVPVVLGLRERLTDSPKVLVTTSTVFGFIWAGLVLAGGMIANIGLSTVTDLHAESPGLAEPVWVALDSVQNGLTGGNEIVGGLWVLLVSFAASSTGALPRGACRLGVIAGAAGLVTVIPGLELVGAIFGLGLIPWFVWVGVMMFRQDPESSSTSGRQLLQTS